MTAREWTEVIKTPCGLMETFIARPEIEPSVAVFVYMDVFGLREEIFDFARAFAKEGMLGIAPDLFHRLPISRFTPADAKHENVDPAAFAGNMGTSREMSQHDTKAVLAWLDRGGAGPRPRRCFAIGYCMGGKHALGVVSAMPDRFTGGMSVHGGQLVTEAPSSPHRLVAGLKRPFHFACAEEDPICPEAHCRILRKEAEKADVDVTLDVLPAHHGWSFPGRWSYEPDLAAHIHMRACKMIAEGLA